MILGYENDPSNIQVPDYIDLKKKAEELNEEKFNKEQKSYLNTYIIVSDILKHNPKANYKTLKSLIIKKEPRDSNELIWYEKTELKERLQQRS